MLSTLAADRARVAEIDAELLALERLQCTLRIQRAHALERKAQVQKRLTAYKYPVLTLPNEVIAEIFIHCIPIYPSCRYRPFTGAESPTLLTRICRKWRGIALETPALWRAISLPDPGVPPEKQGALCDTWLSRSRGCPISVQFNLKRKCEIEILPGIAPHRARLEYLAVNKASLAHLRDIAAGPMPLLCHLELRLFGKNQHVPGGAKVSFLDAPLLRTVLLNFNAAVNTMMPWAQLTALALFGLFPRECAPILQRASNLVHCQLAFAEDDEEEDVLHVTLPALQTLALTHYGLEHDAVTGYLHILTAPALRRLRVPKSFLGPNAVDTLKSFISRSGCKLEELCITGRELGSLRSYQATFPSTKLSQSEVSSAEWPMPDF
ncbi:F-box domain-containing protein [Mycena sanguinolenta]|uniref:F-box domain-containing protein n=1 Tax=Mycena sanguinolenta TaxID=230812 RepID=A0A8H6YZF7_9AGAR|nr:F-box domain-containing protein [Mycena sanguinolenta]